MKPIKDIWGSSYTLTEQLSKKERLGLLIKVLFSTGQIGYNCLHPLSAFREGKLSDYIQILKNKPAPQIIPKNYQTALLHTTLQFAYMDADARSKNQSLLFGYPPIQNHYLISNIKQSVHLDPLPFSIFKIKMGSQLQIETIHLRRIIKNTEKKIHLRLDFNEQLSKNQWKKWEKENKDLIPFIDFIEDPFLNFTHISSDFHLACDWSCSHHSPIRVLKASRHAQESICRLLAKSQFHRIIFTHSLNHPLEARLSWAIASQFYKIHPQKREVCGLNYPLSFYEKNDFSCFYSNFYAPLGTGLGFDSLLNKQNWKKLR